MLFSVLDFVSISLQGHEKDSSRYKYDHATSFVRSSDELSVKHQPIVCCTRVYKRVTIECEVIEQIIPDKGGYHVHK